MTKLIIILVIATMGCQQQQKETTTSEDPKHVAPVKIHGMYSLTTGNVSIEIDSNAGARIASLKINGNEILYTSRDSNNNNWGSTLWPSPQALWGWPPPGVLDNSPYSAIVEKEHVTFTSQKSVHPQLSFTKRFSAHPEDTSIQITYGITNQSDSALSTSAWEITRVPGGGLIFFPKGDGALQGDLSVLTQNSQEIIWLKYDSTQIPAGVPKLFADGSEGWIAYVNHGHQLFVKKFEDSKVSAKAPDPENEIELYMNPNRAYTEIEEQGAYTKLAPNASLEWKVTWYVRNLPHGMDAQIGSQALLDYVRSIVK